MKVILDGYNTNDITVCEYLEPQGAFYSIIQGDKEIQFENTYQIKELIASLQFIIKNN